jgi:hypothetical protein
LAPKTGIGQDDIPADGRHEPVDQGPLLVGAELLVPDDAEAAGHEKDGRDLAPI